MTGVILSCARRLPTVALIAALVLPATACAKKNDPLPRTIANGVVQLAKLPKANFRELSGLVASRQYPGVLWTHNDGQDRRLLAIDRSGSKLAEFELGGVPIEDLEDLAIDSQNRLYVADIGNNRGDRPDLRVFRLPEPDPGRSGQTLAPEAIWTLEFPGAGFDAEALFVWRDFGYVISKSKKRGKGKLYRWPLSAAGQSVVLEEIGKLDVKSPITGADLSPDGRKLGLVSTDGAYVIDVRGPIEAVIEERPFHTKLKVGQIEGCAFADDGLLAVAESRELFLFELSPFRLSKPAAD